MGKQHYGNSLLQKKNVGEQERLLSAIAGTALLTQGLVGKRSLFKILADGLPLYMAAARNRPAYPSLAKPNLYLNPQNISIRAALTINRPVTEIS